MTLARRWASQDRYAAEIAAAADRYGVPRPLAFGLVAQESGFNPSAYRAEPAYRCSRTGAVGDGSYGLTQILLCTAQGLGFTGSAAGLLDPRTNLDLGLRYLASEIKARGTVAAGLSSYNGGYRPAAGYGAPIGGRFANQEYVDGVLEKTAYFTAYLQQAAPIATAGAGGWLGWILIAGLAGALVHRYRPRRSYRYANP